MNPAMVFLVYGSSFVLALALLYFVRVRWYWHAMSLLAALAMGIYRFPPEWKPPDLVLGFLFFLLFVWGLGAAFWHPRKEPKQQAARHA